MYEPAPPLPVPGEAVQEVRSAEQVALHFPIAGPGTRVLAYAADAVVLAIIQITVIVVLLLTTPLAQTLSELLQPFIDEARGGGRADHAVVTLGMLVIALLIIGQLVVEWAYFMISERLTGGRSIGKRLVGLRVIGQDGLPLTARASLVRNLLRAVDVLPGSYVVGLVAIVASPKCQRLGDLAAGTIVVRFDRGTPLEMPIETDVGGDAFRFSHGQIAALGPLERRLLRQTLRRLEVMDSELSAAALERTVEVLRARMGYEPVAPAQRLDFLRALLHTIERG
ncbi:MAG TPA: RDD family protein [Candidatus Dormibacteraeota bacterium]|nr:RDD family protein [Candidatus Dormibacteraeota bacterium]